MSFASQLRQTLTYWQPGSLDRYGKPTWTTPVQKPCHWENKQIQVLNKQGVMYVAKSRVFTADPLDIDGYLLLGVSSAPDPSNVAGVLEIQQVDSVPDLKASKTLYTAFCG